VRAIILLAFSLFWQVCGYCAGSTLGASTCGRWLENKSDDIRAQSEVKFKNNINDIIPLFVAQQNRALDRRWLLGFVSGASAAMEADLLATVDAESVVLWIDNYCASHPIDGVPLAASMLVIELEKKAKKISSSRK